MEDYEKPIEDVIKSGEKAYFSKVKNKYPDREKIDRTNEIIKLFNIKNGRELLEFYNKADAILLADIFEKSIKMSISEFGYKSPLPYIFTGNYMDNWIEIYKS